MTRPNIIRADTIDLQSQDAPSAKDHTRQPAHPAPLGDGPPAPHQAVTLKHAEQEASDLHLRSPRVSQDLSGKELQLLHDVEDGDSYNVHEGEDTYGLGRSVGAVGAEGDSSDAEGDESMDDDMLDKISSSPSIDDGGCHLPLPWPDRGDSLVCFHTAEEDIPPTPREHEQSSSPFITSPAHFPLFYPKDGPHFKAPKDHHQKVQYPRTRNGLLSAEGDLESESRDRLSPLPGDQRTGFFQDDFRDLDDSYDGDFDPEDFRHLLLPADDPLLDNSFDDEPLSPSSSISTSQDPQPRMDHTFPEEPGADDDTETISFSDDARFVDSGWGGECLREAEDIDFEFVYALHTFVATVEGQANASKGDTMVLLDDSNSYWWLVRVVKDSSIGYLPAEHIETPTERLARLNKHRNIDLSQTMLGDNPEKSKNPLKKAMRRRNAKTVQFSAPTYVEASDVDYSSDEEEEGDGGYFGQGHDEEETNGQDQEQDLTTEGARVEPPTSSGQPLANPQAAIDPRVDAPVNDYEIDDRRPSEDAVDQTDDDPFAKSRKGTVRNTDSFFKDDNTETRKINLTPSLLRDDSNSTVTTIRSLDPKDPLKTRPSLDSLDKSASPQDRAKEDKRRKEKKGMLGGLFKRKDKKVRGQDEENEGEKLSDELVRGSPQGKGSSESLPLDQQPTRSPPQSRPQRQTSKLQKAPPPGMAPRVISPPGRREVVSPPGIREVISPKPNIAEQQNRAIPPPNRPPPSVGQITIPKAFEEPRRDLANDTRHADEISTEPAPEEPIHVESPKESRRGMFSPIKDALLSSAPSSSEPKPEKVKKAKQRMPMDDFDSDYSPDTEEQPDPLLQNPEPVLEQERQGQHTVPSDAIKERLSESPIEVTASDIPRTQQQPYGQHDRGYDHQQLPHTERSPQERSYNQQQQPFTQRSPIDRSYSPPQHVRSQQTPPFQPPPLVNDTSSAEEPSNSPTSPTSTPSLIEAPQENDTSGSVREETPASTAQSSNAPPWNDASLRAYLEDDSDIRDLLLLVHDKSDIKPAPPDHPIAKSLFKEENRRLGEMERQLDGLLGKVLERRKEGRVTAVR